MDEELDLLDDVSLMGVAESSPFKQKKKTGLNQDQLKRGSTLAYNPYVQAQPKPTPQAQFAGPSGGI